MPYLVQNKIDGTTVEQWELTDKPLIFGRGDDADCRLKDERVSRQHFAIVPKDGGYIVQDLKSTNGTYLNNTRVSESPLKANDKIRIGQTVLVYLPDKPKGEATIMGEVEAEGLHTYIATSADSPAKIRRSNR